MKRTTRRLVSALVLAGLVALTGCSDDDGDTAPDPTTADATTTTAASTATTAPATGPFTCADQAFTPNSDDIAADIVATGLSCAEAEALVRRIGPLVGAVGGPAEITVAGYECLRTSEDDGAQGLPSSDYRCTSGATSITFTRT